MVRLHCWLFSFSVGAGAPQVFHIDLFPAFVVISLSVSHRTEPEFTDFFGKPLPLHDRGVSSYGNSDQTTSPRPVAQKSVRGLAPIHLSPFSAADHLPPATPAADARTAVSVTVIISFYGGQELCSV
jgi:hypothetical protein